MYFPLTSACCAKGNFPSPSQSQCLVEVCHKLCATQDSGEKSEALEKICPEAGQAERHLCDGVHPAPHSGMVMGCNGCAMIMRSVVM